MAEEPTRKGKIARLPARIREQVCRRMHDGEPAPKIIAWLHTEQEVLAVLDEMFGEEPISAQNLSEWRAGGYQDWLRKRERIERIKQLSDYSLELAQAGAHINAPAAIAGGQLLEILEGVDPALQRDLLMEKPATYIDLLNAMARLQKSGADASVVLQNDIRLRQADEKLSQSREKLALEKKKFERQTAELFIAYFEDRRAKEIIESKGGKEVKMEQLIQLMFGSPPEE